MNMISTLVPIKIFPHVVFVGICLLNPLLAAQVCLHNLTPCQHLDIRLGKLNEESEV